MTRERFEQILFANVSDEVVQDMLNQYVLELESSNATLRMRVASLESALEGMHLIREMDLAENAKLRELLTDILSYVYDGGFNCSEGTWSCPYFQECFNCPIEEGPERYVRRGCRWLVRGRELGIEVKECMTR